MKILPLVGYGYFLESPIICYCYFLKAETDSIDSLEAYRMKSQPTFLFYAVSITTRLSSRIGYPYENLQPDTARIQPDSGQKAFFAARMERDKARHDICLALQGERDICLATVRAGIWLDLNVTGRD